MHYFSTLCLFGDCFHRLSVSIIFGGNAKLCSQNLLRVFLKITLLHHHNIEFLLSLFSVVSQKEFLPREILLFSFQPPTIISLSCLPSQLCFLGFVLLYLFTDHGLIFLLLPRVKIQDNSVTSMACLMPLCYPCSDLEPKITFSFCYPVSSFRCEKQTI